MYNLNPQMEFIPTCIPIPQYKYTPLAKSYIIFQTLGRMYPIDEALEKGTLFPELYVPYDYPGLKGGYCK